MNTLKEYLEQRRVETESIFTHTSLTGGKYYIPTDEEETFLSLYSNALSNKQQLSITEKHRDISPILIDLDFRQTTNERLYNDEHITHFLCSLIEALCYFNEASNEQLQFYILEKPHPRTNKSNGFKDGVHIVCPFIITKPIVQYAIRKKILQQESPFKDMPFTNNFEDMYDEAVIEKNNWFMYGSKKPNEQHPWKVTKVYDSTLTALQVHHNNEELISILSIRNKFDETQVHNYRLEELQVFKEAKRVTREITNHQTMLPPSALDTITKLVQLLNPTRADNYFKWIEVGLCLNNISINNLTTWIEFSKQSSKFVSGECERRWQTFTPKSNGLTEGSLRYWAMTDSPEGYKALLACDITPLIRACMNKSHADIAKVVYHLYKGRFVCCFFNDKPMWFEFKDHRWHKCPDGITLKSLMSNEVSTLYTNEKQQYLNMISDDIDPTIYVKCANILHEISVSLKNIPFQRNILSASSQLFYVATNDFYERLDENKSLLGFDNGVYDLEQGYFRDGLPEDYITFSVGYDYTSKPDIEKTHILQKILTDTFPEDVLPYMLNTGSYALSGHKNMEFMQFWIGTGANGKGVCSTLFTKTLGDYCYCPDVSVFTTKKTSSSSANPELAKMKGKRMAIATEPNESDKFQVGQLKAWTGGDKIQARQLYQDTIEFSAQFLIIIQMNHKPALSDFDMGIARRLKNVEFPFKFVDNPRLPHERQGDVGLKKRIEEDVGYAQQFMLLLLENYRKNIQRGRKFPTPSRVEQYTKEYLDANDKVGAFLIEFCDITNNEEDIIVKRDLYVHFCSSDYYNGQSKENFTEHMEHHGFKVVKIKKRGPYRDQQVFYGLKVKQDIEEEYYQESEDDMKNIVN